MYHPTDTLEDMHPGGDVTKATMQHGLEILTAVRRERLILQRGLDALFGCLLGAYGLDETVKETGLGTSVCSEPDVDMYESPQDYMFYIALPGIEPEAIQVHVTPHRIHLTAPAAPALDKQEETASEQGMDANEDKQASSFVNAWQLSPRQPPHLYTRRRQGRYSDVSRFVFEQTFCEEIVPEQVQARLRHGRLALSLPKRKPTFEQEVQVVIEA